MKITGFLKLLNRKIYKYDKAATNPFINNPVSVTLIWVDKCEEKQSEEYNLDKY